MATRLTASVAAALLALGVAATPALGQSEQAPAAPSISDEQLDQFAEAALAVNRIGQQYASQLQAAENEEQAQEIRAEAQEEMVQAVEEEGLTVDRYNEIYAAAENDEEVNAAIQALLQEKQSEQSSGG